MKNRIIISVLTVCFLLSPFYAFAQEADVAADAAVSNSAIADFLYEIDDIATKPRVFFEYNSAQQETPKDIPKTGCKAAYLADPISGKVFYEKNAHKRMYPASTTKLLTALVVLETCDLEETAVVSQNAVRAVPKDYISADLKAGEEFSVFCLLQALLIPSANDAALVLAEHVSGSVKAFAKLCNRRAKELGCETLHFVNPNGIHDANHYCSAYDLYLIAKECKKYDAFNEIVTTTRFTLPATAVYPKADRTFQNTNALLDPASSNYYYSNCTGIKTGYTPQAGKCMVASSSDENLDLISVILGGKDEANGKDERFSDSKKLLKYVYKHYSYQLIADKNKPLAQVKIANATKGTKKLDIVIQTDISSVVPNNITPDQIHYEMDLKQDLKAPIKQNQVLGTVTYNVDGLIYATNLVAKQEVVKKTYWLFCTLIAFLVLLVVVFIILYRRHRKK